MSRSEQKRRVKDVEKLVAELVKLPAQVLAQVDDLEEVRDALLKTAQLEGSVRQRQIKYLTKRIALLPLEPLYDLVGQYLGRELVEKKQQHLLEFYRDALIDEALAKEQDVLESGGEWGEGWSSKTIAELQEAMPETDPLTLARLAYLFTRTRNPRYSREIFRYLKSVQELRQRNL
ncbi:DarP family protein [Desulfobulbus propionicus]